MARRNDLHYNLGMQPVDGPLGFTLCFLTRGDQVLMLHRRKAPNRGLWNGVGGHLEPGESPLAGCLREVWEETGLRITAARFGGLVTWEGFEAPPGGLYLFTAEAPPGEVTGNGEGDLAWRRRGWVFSSPQVVGNIHLFAPLLLAGAAPRRYHFVYRDGRLVGHTVHPLPPHVRVE